MVPLGEGQETRKKNKKKLYRELNVGKLDAASYNCCLLSHFLNICGLLVLRGHFCFFPLRWHLWTIQWLITLKYIIIFIDSCTHQQCVGYSTNVVPNWNSRWQFNLKQQCWKVVSNWFLCFDVSLCFSLSICFPMQCTGAVTTVPGVGPHYCYHHRCCCSN